MHGPLFFFEEIMDRLKEEIRFIRMIVLVDILTMQDDLMNLLFKCKRSPICVYTRMDGTS